MGGKPGSGPSVRSDPRSAWSSDLPLQAAGGVTASLAFELEAFNVRVKLVEPGYCPNTRFASNTQFRVEEPEAYAPFAQRIMAAFAQPTVVTEASHVAEGVWRAANDSSGTLRFPAGPVVAEGCTTTSTRTSSSCRHRAATMVGRGCTAKKVRTTAFPGNTPCISGQSQS